MALIVLCTTAGIVSINGQKTKAETYLSNSDLMLVLRNDFNVLDNSKTESDIFLARGSSIKLNYSGYTWYDDGKWGSISPQGYVQTTNRLGGLVSVEYKIDQNPLRLDYGFNKQDIPYEFYTSLPVGEGIYYFEHGSPSNFKLSNEKTEVAFGNDVGITYLKFHYSCSDHDCQQSSLIKTFLENDTTLYATECSICHKRYGDYINYDENYAIDIGTAEGNSTIYYPSTVHKYTSYDSLTFDPNDEYTFKLAISGNHSSEDLYAKSHISSSITNSKLDIISSGPSTSLKSITFKGGWGQLETYGTNISFASGNSLWSEAFHTIINSPLTFTNSNNTNTAIDISNGKLSIGNSGNVSISGYNRAIDLEQSITNDGFILESSGILSISSCNKGLRANYDGGTITFKGTSTISSNEYPLQIKNNSAESSSTPQSQLIIKKGTHNWTSTESGKTCISVGKLEIGDSTGSPTLTITTNGGKGISDASSTGVDTFNFNNGTTIIKDSNNGQSDNYGIFNYGKNVINIASDAILNINNFATGIVSNSDVSTVNNDGEMNINGATLYGMYDTSLVVGKTNANAKTRVQVSTSRSSSSRRVSCIKINEWESVIVKSGFLLCHSTAWEYTQGILIDCDFSSSRILIETGAKLGFGKVGYGLNIGGSTYSGNFSSAVIGEYHQYAVGDNAWNSYNKIPTTTKDDKNTFNSIFGTSF